MDAGGLGLFNSQQKDAAGLAQSDGRSHRAGQEVRRPE